MIKSLAAFLLLAAGWPLCAQVTSSVHPWTSSDGKVIEAKFIRTEADAVVIERDGKSFTIPFTKLAPTSVELAKRLKENATGAPATTAAAASHVNAATITNKLSQIIIPKIDFSDTPVREAIDFLRLRSVELDSLEADPKRKGVEIVFNKSTTPEKIDALRIGNLSIRNVPLNTALKYVCDQTKLRFIVEGSQVMLIPQVEYVTEIHSRTFIVPVDFLVRLAANSGGGGDSKQESRKPIIQYLGACGVAFPEGASATLSGNQLEVSNTRKELDKIEQLVTGLAAEAASDPTIRFRWLQTDPKTADAIVDLIKANTMEADAFSARIDPQIKSGKITEVAAFDRKIISGERFLLRPAAANLPLVMEAEAAVSHDGLLMDLRCVPEWYPKTPLGSGLLRCNIATTLSRKHWSLFARWGDAKTDTLLLACGGAEAAKPAVPQPAWELIGKPLVVHLDAEWRETNTADLAKVVEIPAESRAKALVWLRGRSKLIASATGTCKSGMRSRHEHLWGGKSDAELEAELNKHPDSPAKEPPPRPGVTLAWEVAIMASDKLKPEPTLPPSTPIEGNLAKEKEYIRSQELNLRLNATYVPLKARSKSQAAEFLFNGELQAGMPEFVSAQAAPPEGQQVVVLILTPWYEIIR